MNLAYRDIRHSLGRFVLTCIGLGLLLGVVLAMIGIYRGLVVDALTIARAPAVDLWVVEANTRGPFAEASRIPGDIREGISRIAGVAAAGSITYQTVEAQASRKEAAALCDRLRADAARRLAGDRRRPHDLTQPLRTRGRSHERPRTG
jgi:hypothetical protein